MKPPQLIVFAGLPGTGKSSIAEAVGRVLGIPLILDAVKPLGANFASALQYLRSRLN